MIRRVPIKFCNITSFISIMCHTIVKIVMFSTFFYIKFNTIKIKLFHFNQPFNLTFSKICVILGFTKRRISEFVCDYVVGVF